MEVPRDCSYRAGSRRCTAPARWELVGPDGLPVVPICNVHRSAAADLVQVLDAGGWMWADRKSAGLWPAHRNCLGDSSSIGRRQTCQGAGSPSRVVCPLMGDQRSGSTEWPGRGRVGASLPLSSEGGLGSGAAPQGRRWWSGGGRTRPALAPEGVTADVPRGPEDGPDWLAFV